MIEPKLTPAMRVWVERLRKGYTIRPRRVWRKKEGGLTWRPALYNPEGAFVQMVRLDTAQRLQAMGHIRMPGDGENEVSDGGTDEDELGRGDGSGAGQGGAGGGGGGYGRGAAAAGDVADAAA